MKKYFTTDFFVVKLLLLIFVSLHFSMNVISQQTYTSADYAAAGDSFVITTAPAIDLSMVSFDTTGANILWDYDSLVPVTQRIDMFLDPDNTGYKNFWWSLCYAECLDTCTKGIQCLTNCTNDCNNEWNNSFNLAVPTRDSIYLGVVTLYDLYDFYNNANNGLIKKAFGATVYGVPLIFEYEVPDTVYKFPLQYGNTSSSQSKFSIDLNSLGINVIYKHNQTRFNDVEGWGTLITPFGTFDSTLKVRSDIYAVDSIFTGDTVYTLSNFIPEEWLPDSLVEYHWFSKNYGIPLLTAQFALINGVYIPLKLDYIDTLSCFTPVPLFGYLPVQIFLDPAGNADVNFYNLSVNADSIYWNFNDPASGIDSISFENHPAHTFGNDGIYMVKLTACNTVCDTCNTLTLPVVVIDSTAVYANFSFTPRDPCVGDSVWFINSSVKDSSWKWSFGDGGTSTLQNPIRVYTDTGTYNVSLIAFDSTGLISDTVYKQIMIGNAPKPNFSYSDTITDVDIQFNNTSANTNDSTFYLWTFLPNLVGGACPDIYSSTLENPRVIFDCPGKVSACLLTWNSLNCQALKCEQITITECLNVDFNTSDLTYTAGKYRACEGAKATFKNLTTGLGAINYQWQIGGTTFSTNKDSADYTFSTAGEFTLRLIAINSNCTDTLNVTVKVSDVLDAGVDVGICKGDSVVLTATGKSVLGNYTWAPLAGLSCTVCASTVAKPVLTTTYKVTITFPNEGCFITTDSVTVWVADGPPFSDFSYSVNGYTLSLTDLSVNRDDGYWSFGDGTIDSTTQNPVHIYSDTGNYIVTQYVFNACGSDSHSVPVTITCTAPPVANFGAVNLNDSTISFIDSSSNSNLWVWDFGDGTKDSTQNPTHTYADTGKHFVTLYVYNDCGSDTLMDTVVTTKNVGISVLPVKIAAFNVHPNPYKNEIQISYGLNKTSKVLLEVYNIIGEKVKTIVNNDLQKEGEYKYYFSSKKHGYDSGIYLVKLVVDDKIIATKRIVEYK